MKPSHFACLLSLFACSEMFGQDTIRLKNPSFEQGKIDCDELPSDWKPAGNSSQKPETQPGCGKAKLDAQHGERYLCLLTKSSGAKQGLRQSLEGIGLEQGKEYGFSLFMAKSKVFWSEDAEGDSKLHDRPAALQIWGTNKAGMKRELLAESVLVQSQNWRAFNFVLKPKDGDWSAIELIAQFETPWKTSNGHLFLDDLQPIVVLKTDEARWMFDDPKSVRSLSKDEEKADRQTRPKFTRAKKEENVLPPIQESHRAYPESSVETEVKYGGKENAPSLIGFDTNLVRGHPVQISNPSFEATPKCCEAPIGWENCGYMGETGPDVQPGYFSVIKAPLDGETYLGMVVRDNDTQEAISQRLALPLEKGKTYEFSVAVARSEQYFSMSRSTGELVNYATPAALEIYGGNSVCGRMELLAKTKPIAETKWVELIFRFSPRKHGYDYLIFRAAHDSTSTLAPYNGNLLLDKCSPIYEMTLKKR